MFIYLFNIFLLALFAIIFLWDKRFHNKKIFCIIATIQWIIISGFRHISIGADTETYKFNFFDVIMHGTWEDVIDNFANTINGASAWHDPGYTIFNKLVQVFITDYQGFLLLIAMVFTIPLGIWIYKNSTEPFISFLIYSCLFSSFFAITGHRQTIATALVVLIGYKFINEKKFFPFLFLTLIAMTIHKSAICFLNFYFIANIKITKNYLIIMAAVVFFMFVLKNQLMVLLGVFMGYEIYIEQFNGAGAWNFTTILLSITIISIWRSKIMLKKKQQVTHYINALIVALAFTPLTFVDPNAMRVVQYFSLFLMLLVPEIIKSFQKQERIILYYLAVTILILLFAKNEPQYLFFWQV